ncbi:anoctamin-4-like isoform X2 [Dendronephthya gigantea]|uniref:anoctamin-4-like isoform X2 n=1 Tax=Dendronephthya gigantea TaxID=151771 RepID=UPI00106AC4DC|nr:anoctamin-4-like isoform X2 [Dendronephthya gigantea]
MEMFKANEKEYSTHKRDILPPLEASGAVNHSIPSSEGHKRKRRKKKRDIGSRIKTDSEILVENDLLVHRTNSIPSTVNGSYMNVVESETANNNFDLQQKRKSDLPEDVRKVALTLAVSNIKPQAKENLATLDHIDYVLVFCDDDKHKEMSNEVLNELRNKFEKKVELEGVTIVRKKKGNTTFVVMSCSFERLCQEAEAVSLKMPLAGFEAPYDRGPLPGFWERFKTDDEVDLVSALFCASKKEIYEGIEDPNSFFRPSLRTLLVYHILINLNLKENTDVNTWHVHRSDQGLAYMLMHGVYSDALCIHAPSKMDPMYPDISDEESIGNNSFLSSLSDVKESDPRKNLNDTWLKWKKFQPLWKIRNYFGEQIALYFAWLGLLVSSLWIPMIIGLIVALWGFTNAIEERKSSNDTLSVGDTVQGWLRGSFDNDATPFFALITCLWGTIFLELWKRKNAELAYQWDVSDFEEQEPNRPQFYGTKIQKDPITGKDVWVYPLLKKYKKLFGSLSVLLFMVCLVLAATAGIIIYRVISRVDLFDRKGSIGPTLASVTSSFLNTICIMVMGKCYQRLAVILTEWENHRTQTSYDDALIVKLFAFQFVNSYASLYYIAFFRGSTNENGVLNKGAEYSDSCGENNDCMTMLSLQVAMLMIMKPLPKFCTDYLLPCLERFWHRHVKRGCCWCCKNQKVHSSFEISIEDVIECELEKPELGDFTLSEYSEKVIQYGFLMLFAAAFPLAPLIALVTNMFDLRLDARRLLWTNRRPVAFRAEDIGMWYSILEFLNVVGVVTNSFLVAFTSQYGRNWEGDLTHVTVIQEIHNSTTNATVLLQTITEQAPSRNRLWLIIGFEHIVFAVKFLIALVIPDVPSHVRIAERREKYHVDQLLEKAGVSTGPRKKPSQTKEQRDMEVQTSYSTIPSSSKSELGHSSFLQTQVPSKLRSRANEKDCQPMATSVESDAAIKNTNIAKEDLYEHSQFVNPIPPALPLGYKPNLPVIDNPAIGSSVA